MIGPLLCQKQHTKRHPEVGRFSSCYMCLKDFLLPSVLNHVAHVDSQPPLIRPFWYKLFSVGMIMVLVVAIVAVVGSVAWKKQQERNKKRFF